jgi:hypothetical protein
VAGESTSSSLSIRSAHLWKRDGKSHLLGVLERGDEAAHGRLHQPLELCSVRLCQRQGLDCNKQLKIWVLVDKGGGGTEGRQSHSRPVESLKLKANRMSDPPCPTLTIKKSSGSHSVAHAVFPAMTSSATLYPVVAKRKINAGFPKSNRWCRR